MNEANKQVILKAIDKQEQMRLKYLPNSKELIKQTTEEYRNLIKQLKN